MAQATEQVPWERKALPVSGRIFSSVCAISCESGDVESVSILMNDVRSLCPKFTIDVGGAWVGERYSLESAEKLTEAWAAQHGRTLLPRIQYLRAAEAKGWGLTDNERAALAKAGA